jgi:cold shock protein
MLSRAYSSTVPRPDERTHAIVEWWSDEEGWGALTESDEMPGGAFVHFSAIQVEGYKSLRAGQKVDARIEGPLPFDQDRYRYRATEVWPLT